MDLEIESLVKQLSGDLNDKSYEISDELGRIGSEIVLTAMIDLLHHDNAESRYLAARTMGLMKNNATGLEPLLLAIHDKENKGQAGDLMVALEAFDLSDNYVDIFKLYLFGSFKVSMIAKDLLDYKEFNITLRVIKKIQKHWNHYSNNVKQDEVYVLRKIEVEEIIDELKNFVEEV